jgi:sugar phosphate isomerase/epimerase
MIMFRNLCPGAIGVPANLQQSIEYAKLGQFGGIDVPFGEAEAMLNEQGADAVKALFADNGMQMGSIGWPVRWMGSEDDWKADLAALPKFCAVAQKIGATRTATWVPSWNDEKAWDENWAFHVERFKPVADIMGEYGVRMGLEFLGPRTLYVGKQHHFISTAGKMLELCAELGPNAGLLLDAWHWHTSGGTIADLKAMTNANVVYVHINDAPPGLTLDDYVDNQRAISGETGVIDLTGFLQALQAIGYDGPVTPEPFSQRLNGMEDKAEAVKVAGDLLKEVFDKAGV